MGAADWDVVPQPICALAFRHMAEYWSGDYRVDAEHGIPRMPQTGGVNDGE